EEFSKHNPLAWTLAGSFAPSPTYWCSLSDTWTCSACNLERASSSSIVGSISMSVQKQAMVQFEPTNLSNSLLFLSDLGRKLLDVPRHPMELLEFPYDFDPEIPLFMGINLILEQSPGPVSGCHTAGLRK